MTAVFSDSHIAIVRFCAVECEMQQSGEASVADMIAAWRYAYRYRQRQPTRGAILKLGKLVEPEKNARGYRQVPVYVGSYDNQKLDWPKIPDAMDRLLTFCGDPDINAGEWFREYEEIHPFRDGNGRTGQILFNWLGGTLASPEWAPNFWDDSRRVEGRGA